MDLLTEQTSKTDILITPAAKKRILELLSRSEDPNLNLRIYLSKGGCSGFEYSFAFDQLEEEDIVIQDDVKIIVDPISCKYLDGSTLDYLETPESTGFTIIGSKTKSSCCGCNENSCC